MASNPKRERLMKVLRDLAAEEVGPDAEPLEALLERIAAGRTFPDMADEMTSRMGESCSPSWLRSVACKLPGYSERAREARSQGAHALAEQALAIADEPAKSTTDVQRNRLRVEQRMALAKAFSPDFRDKASATLVQFDLGQAHLAALKQIAARDRQLAAETERALLAPARDELADYEIVEQDTRLAPPSNSEGRAAPAVGPDVVHSAGVLEAAAMRVSSARPLTK
jgi:hypothetical protein